MKRLKLQIDYSMLILVTRQNENRNYIITPKQLHVPLKDRETKVIKVACGRAHTLLLTDKEGGENSYY